MQGVVRCFSLVSGRVLHRSWKDVTTHKMREKAIRRINFMAEKKHSMKGLLFGDRQNDIDRRCSTGVEIRSQGDDKD